MKETVIIYIIIWLLVVVPLILFNLRRMFHREPPEHKLRIRWKFFSIIAVVFVLSSVFLYFSAVNTLTARYEIATERYVTVHANYLLGNTTEQEWEQQTAQLETSDYAAHHSDTSLGSYNSAQTVKFQIGDRIVPKYYQDEDVFPQTDIIDDENPVYVMYLIDIDGQREYYYLRLIQQEDHSWLVDAHAKANGRSIPSRTKKYASY